MSSIARSLVASSSRISAARSATRNSLTRWMSSRRLHKMRPLPYSDDGVGDFLPPPALKTVVEWQKGLLERLNDLVRDTEFANQSIVQTILGTALSEENTLAFNYASLALNNSYFLDNLKPIDPGSKYPHHERHITLTLADAIRQQFGDFDQLKSTFSAAASGLSASGWIWLVTDGRGRLAVLPTFGAGTLLIMSRRLMIPRGIVKDIGSVTVPDEVPDDHDLQDTSSSRDADGRDASRNPLPPFADGPQSSMRSSPTSGVHASAPPLKPSTPSRTLHSTRVLANIPASLYGVSAKIPSTTGLPEPLHVQQKLFSEMGQVLYPLLCLSVHEHAWMSAGLGVWGRDEYSKRFWSVVDWEKVSQVYDATRPTNPNPKTKSRY